MSVSPLARYRQTVKRDALVADPAQREAIEKLDQLYWQLQKNSFSPIRLKSRPIKGLYLWGEVGRGKTLLMDLFYNSLPGKQKLRLHFHRFMARIHREMHHCVGKSNPLQHIAKNLAGKCRVLCFDEFFVTDIGDAMLLEQLFTALFRHGVVLVATSNLPIEKLYDVELHRHKFDNTRALLKQYTQAVHLKGDTDHRLHQPRPYQTYFLTGEANFDCLFNRLADSQKQHSGVIQVCNRPIKTIRHCDNLAWFHFEDLCKGPRSQLDYIELAGRFACILVSELPRLGGETLDWIKARGTEDGAFSTTETGERQVRYARLDDPARRFIALVDELYDQGVKLYLSAQVPLTSLYQGGTLTFEIKRALSRLVEMQSRDYLSAVS